MFTFIFIITTEGSFASSTKRPVIYSLNQPMDNPWVANNIRLQKEVAEALGIELHIVTDQATDESNVAAMRTIIAANPDGILFQPLSEAAGVQGGRLIERAKIPTVTQDRLIVSHISEYKGEYLYAQVTQDNVEWGYRTLENLIKGGGSKILTIMPPHGILTVEQIWKGATACLENYPEVKIVEEAWVNQTRESAIQTMQNYLVKYTKADFDAVIGIGSTMALGAIYVLRTAGLINDVKVITADDDPDVMDALRRGELLTTLGGHWMNGAFGLIVLYDILNGHMPLDRQPQFHLIDINADTADEYQARFLWGKESPFTAEEIRSLSLTYNPDANLPDFMANLWKRWNTESRGF